MPIRIPAIKVNQWLNAWDAFEYDPEAHQAKPQPHFFMASIPAGVLRRLAYVRRRTEHGPRLMDTGIQRAHDETRSTGISRFVDAGYPWASLNTRDQARFPNLKKPGWLPTAIIVNRLSEETQRGEYHADPADLVRIEIQGEGYELVLPEGAERDDWEPSGHVHPIEIVDGQHRLLAFEQGDPRGQGFELPCVLFDDLDVSWQAYLFWTINITPVRISPSFAFDLYPLLRTQDWLEVVEGPRTYRETRAQELTEALWSHPVSPWFGRIAMLARERGKVTQAAWVRSLTVTYIKPWENPRAGPGGLFGGQVDPIDSTRVLMWSRPQQAAFLIQLWKCIEEHVRRSDAEWATDLRDKAPADGTPQGQDPAFAGIYSLLNTDQGVRGVLHASNDVTFGLVGELNLQEWRRDREKDATDIEEVTLALKEFAASHREILNFLDRLGACISRFDWRSGGTPGLPEDVRNQQLVYRTGTGYREVRRKLLLFLRDCEDPRIARAAQQIVQVLNYD